MKQPSFSRKGLLVSEAQQSSGGPPTLDARPLLELEQDWDSYGAERITLEAVNTANALTAVPLSDGGIQLEMHAGGIEIEIEIDSTGKVRSILYGLGVT